ncbi:hypothetical protein COV18_05015 [Candidatus Woesearchaeota archaeon CG10_big_fil_rev_8_21_14_0_10_37_12]|nr:MAG: hypothetical protein COV18_05015 [Candidatus Woesearchaeota archaeon CG10_big_fil_rev_8_21_14_0_10_37_12]
MREAKTIESREIETGIYGCPTCEERIVGTYEEAKAHVDIPLGRGVVFPNGFTFGEIHPDSQLIRMCVIGDSSQVQKADPPFFGLSTHDFRYNGITYFPGKTGENNWWRLEDELRSRPPSNILQTHFRAGQYRLLQKSEFDEFLETKFGDEATREINIINLDNLTYRVEGFEKFCPEVMK